MSDYFACFAGGLVLGMLIAAMLSLLLVLP